MEKVKLKLDLELALPSDAAACDACIGRILALLRGRPGIDEAHVETNDGRARLCIHYDTSVLRLERVESLVKLAGAELRSRFDHLGVNVVGLRHERHAKLVEAALAKEPGVLQAAVAFGTRRVYVEFASDKTSRDRLVDILIGAGIDVADGALALEASRASSVTLRGRAHEHGHESGHEHEREREHEHEREGGRERRAGGTHSHGGPFGERSELAFSLACGALTAAGWVATKAVAPSFVPTAFFVVAYVLGSWFTVQEVFVAIRARKLEIDFLMLIAAVGAAVLGEWFEGALLLFLFTLGHALESYAMARARKAIEGLSRLVPATALRVDASGGEEEVPVGELALADKILVKPNTRIAADGFVVSGSSSVNQAPITGESVPVDKSPVPDVDEARAAPAALPAEHRVFAGTINGPAALTISVTKLAADSTLARVVKLVSEAETQASPTQQFTSRFERVFVPAILAVVVLLLFAWLVIDETFGQSFYRAMAVLVAASPCALAIATPSAVLSGVARAARGGVLVKGGANLEVLGVVRAIAFDKTGTLTKGEPKLTDIVTTQGASEEELLRLTLAVERQSDHPLAIAIVEGATQKLPSSATNEVATKVEAIMGFGIRAEVASEPVVIGKPGLFTRDSPLPAEVAHAAERLQAGGRSVMIVKAGERFLGAIGVMDTPRAEARDVIARLHGIGIEQTIMLTGDHQRVADAVAKEIGLREARGDLLPEQKVAAVAELAKSRRLVAMVGDGVNDAPAMANASVGICMGAGSSDVALETADVALMADDLRALPFAIGLSRAARRIIRQNLWASLGMVAFLIPATIFGFAGIGVAVALHEGSTLVVVVNALRLLAYKEKGVSS